MHSYIHVLVCNRIFPGCYRGSAVSKVMLNCLCQPVLEEMRITYQCMSYYVCILIDGWDSVVGMVTGLCAGFPRNCGSFLESVKGISLVQYASLLQSFRIAFRAHPVSHSMGTG
jgi:hypothetical protein